MTVSIRRHSGTDEEWDYLVEQSPMATPFHQSGVLRVIASEADASLHRLVGYKGEEPVGLFPFFEKQKGPLKLVKSPPEGISIILLGPILSNYENLKTRKRERRHRQFVEGCIEWVDDRFDPDRFQIHTTDRYGDFRPWVWNDFDVEMDATYIVDLERELDEIKRSFSRSVRRAIDEARDAGCEIRVGGEPEARRIAEHIWARFEQSDIAYQDTSPEQVLDYYEALPDEQARPYVCLKDGEYVGGKIAVRFGDTTWWWKGGARPLENVPANELLDWQIIRDAKEAGVSRYNLHGAIDPRSGQPKSKLGPDLVPMYKLTRERPSIELATWFQKRVGPRLGL
ncbi:GNAT family N-acetyltransferase [Haloprofundus salinisoli]|uniref:GNAT family N-acetyltransferase n=1 Tax=Haloprofundus salinisoli TaxID=2876193 RepID=UPI001CCBAD3A|nr:GNAT family N-acetyltransferase [Haloprofundus salinisoli]